MKQATSKKGFPWIAADNHLSLFLEEGLANDTLEGGLTPLPSMASSFASLIIPWLLSVEYANLFAAYLYISQAHYPCFIR